MNDSIRRVARVSIFGFLILALAAAYWQVAWQPLNPDKYRQFNAGRLMAQATYIHRGRILDRNGVVIVETVGQGADQQRVTRLPSLGPVVGYDSPRFGKSGIEAMADAQLTGEVGMNAVKALVEDQLHQVRQGLDVQLTIDARVQQVADNALGNRAGAVIAFNPHTGEVLAMASHPYYDPSTLDQNWDQLRNDPSRPLLNRVTQGLYVPGSTFKTVTLAAALDSGKYQPNSLIFPKGQTQCPIQLPVHGFVIVSNNEPSPGPGTHDVTSAYQWSCNTAFAEIGLSLGATTLSDYAQRFGFGKDIPFDLPVAVSQLYQTPGYLDDPAALASTAFGQGQILATPLQMALVAGVGAERGCVPPLYLLLDQPVSGCTSILSPQAGQELTQIMVNSAANGWAKYGAIPGVPSGGKTGTAQLGPDISPHAWYIGFAPADNPTIAVAVIVENGGEGSLVAGPVAKAVMAAALGK